MLKNIQFKNVTWRMNKEAKSPVTCHLKNSVNDLKYFAVSNFCY